MIVGILGFVPFTAMTVVPARLVLGEIGAAEIAVSFVLLVAATWLMRRAVARVYALGMLLYGKEPSLREMWRWLRATSPR